LLPPPLPRTYRSHRGSEGSPQKEHLFFQSKKWKKNGLSKHGTQVRTGGTTRWTVPFSHLDHPPPQTKLGQAPERGEIEDRPEPRKGPGPKPALARPASLAEAKARLREQGRGSNETLIALRDNEPIPDWVPAGGNIRVLDFSWSDVESEMARDEPSSLETQIRASLQETWDEVKRRALGGRTPGLSRGGKACGRRELEPPPVGLTLESHVSSATSSSWPTTCHGSPSIGPE
jgi:hypothetical protein